MNLNKIKPIHRNVRVPKLLDDMVVDIQVLNNFGTWTEAIIEILKDWEKTRYLDEKKRLIELHKIQFAVLHHETTLKKLGKKQ